MLSEQQLVDCTCSGCNGGDYYPAWSYLSNIPGSVASSGYSYTGTVTLQMMHRVKVSANERLINRKALAKRPPLA